MGGGSPLSSGKVLLREVMQGTDITNPTDIKGKITAGGKEFRFTDNLPGLEGGGHSLIAADGKLFVSTLDGRIHCFGEKPDRVLKQANARAGSWARAAHCHP